MPVALIDAGREYRFALQIALDENHRLAQKVSAVDPNEAEPYGATILDIDCIWEGEASVQRDAIEPILEALHNDIGREFSRALTERLLARLNGQPDKKQQLKRG